MCLTHGAFLKFISVTSWGPALCVCVFVCVCYNAALCFSMKIFSLVFVCLSLCSVCQYFLSRIYLEWNSFGPLHIQHFSQVPSFSAELAVDLGLVHTYFYPHKCTGQVVSVFARMCVEVLLKAVFFQTWKEPRLEGALCLVRVQQAISACQSCRDDVMLSWPWSHPPLLILLLTPSPHSWIMGSSEPRQGECGEGRA